jgi:glycosyltransferase involved in cell wall biosynthesis
MTGARTRRATPRSSVLLDILYVGGLAVSHNGGTGVLGTELVTGLARLGHRVRTLTPCPVEATGRCARFQAQQPDVETSWFPIPVASSELLAGSRDPGYREAEDRGIRSVLPRLIAHRRPDVILVGRESMVGEVPPVARRHGIPTVVLVQGGRAFQRIVDRDPDPLAYHQREQIRQVDVVVAIAWHLRPLLAPLGFRRLAVIPNPVDVEQFAPGEKPPHLLRAHDIRPQDLVVAHLSNLGPLKRPMDVIESAARVLAARRDVIYLIVGDGPYRGPMEARCRALGIAERVRFVGWVDHADVPAYLRLTDIVVMPSEREALPLVDLETQASGRVLVASDIPATRELVADGETGLIARRGDVPDLAAKVLRAARDPGLRAVIGRAARKAAHAHATPAILGMYVELMAGLSARQRGAARHVAERRAARVRRRGRPQSAAASAVGRPRLEGRAPSHLERP